jgi:hypothetical protein
MPFQHDTCRVNRRILRTRPSIDQTPEPATEQLERCGTPLYSQHEMRSGVCKNCMTGWEVVGNRFADSHARDIAELANLGQQLINQQQCLTFIQASIITSFDERLKELELKARITGLEALERTLI